MSELISTIVIKGRAVEVRRLKRAAVKLRGGVDRAGTGPQGETCGSCRHLERPQAKTLKCGLNQGRRIPNSKSEVRLRWKACSKWEKRP